MGNDRRERAPVTARRACDGGADRHLRCDRRDRRRTLDLWSLRRGPRWPADPRL